MFDRSACLEEKLSFTRETTEFSLRPIDFIFRTKFGHSELDIIGVLETGHRCLVKVSQLPVFVDILLEPRVEEYLKDQRWERLKQLPGKGFSEPREYGRLFFSKISERRAFIEKYHSVFSLANDDSSYENLLYRFSSISTCGWNTVTRFAWFSKWAESHRGYEREDLKKLPVQVVVEDIFHIEPMPDKKALTLPDRAIICAWDLETYTPHKFGRIPEGRFSEDSIKMCSMTFRFVSSQKPLLWVLITAIPISEVPNAPHTKIIYTQNIPRAFAEVLERMQPDYLTGFNDGFYDWPFLKSRTEDAENFLDKISAVRLQPWERKVYGSMSDKNIYNRPKVIKIDPENTAIFNGYAIPGIIAFDTAPLMRRRDKTETNWSLNTFLKKYSLSQKYDMPYSRMSRIFRLWERTTPEALMDVDGDKKLFGDDPAVGDIAIKDFTVNDALEHFADSGAVGYYCLLDAEAVLNLLQKLFIIQDVREMGILSFTNMKDGIFKADGIKVRNCLLHDAMKREWGLWDEKYSLAFSVYSKFQHTPATKAKIEKTKYPGGWVVPPEKGLYARTLPDKIGWEAVDGYTGSETPDRPNAGLDFSSLYPSLIMCYNFSPEYYLADPRAAPPGVKLLHIKTYFKKDSELTLTKHRREGWFIQQDSQKIDGHWEYTNHGIFPTVLRRLFAARREIKGEMGVWQVIMEKLSVARVELDNEPPTLENILRVLESKARKIAEAAAGFEGQKKRLEEIKIQSYTAGIRAIREKWSGSYEDLEAETRFRFNYYNTKQNAVKVFMNTFYGETGNQKSPFYIVTMSGGVTKMGRKSLKFVKKYVESEGFRVYYGDTDSLYISPPHRVFGEVDRRFHAREISKEIYFEEMVGITMNQLREISERVAGVLERHTGNPFLKMEYEEVLFPFGFLGKKNYFGIKHINSIDFSLCKPGVDLAIFKRELFARGLPLRRRDGSEFVKKILLELIVRLCSLNETRQYDEIIMDLIREKADSAVQEPEKYIDDLLKNYSFREPRDNSHTVQMSYRKRMIRYYTLERINYGVHLIRSGDNYGATVLASVQPDDKNLLERVFPQLVGYYFDGAKLDIEGVCVIEELLGLNFEIPTYGSRINLLLANKPPEYNLRGARETDSKGHLLERKELVMGKLLNAKYTGFLRELYRRLGTPISGEFCIQPHFSSYFEELFGKLSRFLLYKFGDEISAEALELTEKEFEKRLHALDNIEASEFGEESRRARERERILRKMRKMAEIRVMGKIKKKMVEDYKKHFPTYVCDNSALREDFKIRGGEIDRVVGKSDFTRIIRSYVTEDKYDGHKVQNELKKIFEGFYIPKFVFAELPEFLAGGVSEGVQRFLAGRKEKFLGEVHQLCVKIRSLSDYSLMLERLRELNEEFTSIMEDVVISREIERFRVRPRIKSGQDQDHEFEDFLNDGSRRQHASLNGNGVIRLEFGPLQPLEDIYLGDI